MNTAASLSTAAPPAPVRRRRPVVRPDGDATWSCAHPRGAPVGRRGAVVQLLCTIVLTAFVTTVVLGVAHLRTTAVASRGTTADIAVVRVDGDREHAVPLGAR